MPTASHSLRSISRVPHRTLSTVTSRFAAVSQASAPSPTPRQTSNHILRTQSYTTSTPKMSAMEATQGHSKPCCNVPPVVSSGYQVKGSYEEIGGFKTYVTGPKDATKAIVVVYDIFGYFDQTLQGADILAHSDDNQKYKVFMPDWFEGKPCPIEIYPPDTDDKKKQLGDFFGTYPPPKVAGQIPDYVKALKEKDSSITKFAILGYCWGGKVATLSAKADNNPFSAIASIHPAMVDPADADGLTVPTIMLASGDEPADDVKKFEDRLKVAKHVEIFKDQIHGWMAARSDLKDERVKKEYERGYKTLVEFFGQNL